MTLSYGDPQNLINLPALRAFLQTTESEIRDLKRALRRTWQRPMGEEQRSLASLKHRATLLCALRALARGRLHIARRPRRGVDPNAEWEARAYNLGLAKAALDRFELRASEPPPLAMAPLRDAR